MGNGKDYSNEDMNILTCCDSVKNFAEVKMFCDNDEIELNSQNSEIDIKVNILSDTINERIEKQISLGERINRLERVIAILREEIIGLKRIYKHICYICN